MTSLKGQIKQSLESLNSMTNAAEFDKGIPVELIQRCSGIVFMTEVKAGFVWSGSVSGGILIAKLPNGGGWSAPSSLGSGGMGFGFQVGAQKTDTIILLFGTLAVSTFASAGQVKFGGDLSVSAGPVGRSLAADARLGTGGFTGCLSYSQSQGLFGGVSLTGAVLITRSKDNEDSIRGRSRPSSSSRARCRKTVTAPHPPTRTKPLHFESQ